MIRLRGTATRLGPALLSAILVVALAPAGSSAADVAGKVIGQGARLKGTNIWYGHATAVKPRTISVSVAPVPAQDVKVQWAVVCQKRNIYDPALHLAATGKQGTTTVRAPARVTFELPYAKPPTCIATVYATLSNKGALTLKLLQT